jgi:PKD repeat protein
MVRRFNSQFIFISLLIFLSGCGSNLSLVPNDTDDDNIQKGSQPNQVQDPTGPFYSPTPTATPDNGIPINPTDSILPFLTVSRSIGVAPLSVHFDASSTKSAETTRPFHELYYGWDFGDTDPGTWAISKKNKNKATGPIAAHVYEKAGEYTVTLTVRDIYGNEVELHSTITVQDPKSVFSGTKTICISTGGDFSGCPSGAKHLTTNLSNRIQDELIANRRVLLHRGDHWTFSKGLSIRRMNGPGMIGAYGACQNPNDRGICANNPKIQFTSSSGDALFDADESNDWRIADIQMIGNGSSTAGPSVEGITNMRNLLLYRLSARRFESTFMIAYYKTIHDQVSIIECESYDSHEYAAFAGSNRLVVMGNDFQRSKETHILRIFYSRRGVISENHLSGASLESGRDRHALKFHSPLEGGVLGRSRLTVISNNLFGTSGVWPIAVGPESARYNQVVEDIIIEKNQFKPGLGQLGNNRPADFGICIWARNITVRNNIFDGTGAASGFVGVNIDQRGIEPKPYGVVVDHNIVFRQDQASEMRLVRAYNSADQTLVRNNIVWGPKTSNMELGRGNFIHQMNLVGEDPLWVEPGIGDFRLAIGSKAHDAGELIPVLDDFYDEKRFPAIALDIGVSED